MPTKRPTGKRAIRRRTVTARPAQVDDASGSERAKEASPPVSDDDGLWIDYRPLSALKRAPRNPKDHDLGALSESFKRFGFTSPVIVDERTGQLIAGHGRVDGLTQRLTSGSPPPKGIRVIADNDWAIPVIRGWSSKDDADAEAYLIADNQLTILGGWKDGELAAMLRDQAEAGTLLGTGFDADDLDSLLKQLNEEEQPTQSDAELLRQLNVTMAEPETIVEKGSVWILREVHTLVCADVVMESRLWRGYLPDHDVFAPYPGPYSGVVISKPEDGTDAMIGKKILYVQPSVFIAGHLIDQVKRVFGPEAARLA